MFVTMATDYSGRTQEPAPLFRNHDWIYNLHLMVVAGGHRARPVTEAARARVPVSKIPPPHTQALHAWQAMARTARATRPGRDAQSPSASRVHRSCSAHATCSQWRPEIPPVTSVLSVRN